MAKKKHPALYLKHAALLAVLWTLCVIALGAFTRLSDAGLSCPDWPTCYGHLSVPTTQSAINLIDKTNAAHPLVTHKAWAEMIHRYFAGMLGLFILVVLGCAIAFMRRVNSFATKTMSVLLFLLLIYQPLLGMWTVTLKLLPIIVTQHLLGGMSILALLWGLTLIGKYADAYPIRDATCRELRPWAIFGIVLLYMQLFLGAWTSTNYAAITCDSFPFCQMASWPLQFHAAFNLLQPVGANYDGGILTEAARKTIQMTHRAGALVVFIYWASLISTILLRVKRYPKLHNQAFLVAVLLFVQICLGIANVLLKRPLLVASCHNMGAALLLLSMISLCYRLYRGPKC